MKNRIIIFCAMVCFAIGATAQNVTVTDAIGQSPAAFIQNNLLGGGVYIFNAKFSNSTNNISTPNIGTFQANGYMGLSMENGIIMTTGDISLAPGPNSSSSSQQPVTGYFSDQEMSIVATNTIYGCSTLDFDFVTLASSISFNYTFASEEYPEYVCSNFNDVFAFFVTGPDPETGEEVTRNIAIIPNTIDEDHPNGIAVAINSVNPGVPGASSGGGSGTGCYYDYSDAYEENPEGTPGIEYDGFTTKLTASAQILPCVVYHMHISVCNVGDNAYDSGVFLEGNSFSANTAAIGLSRPGVTAIHGSCPNAIPLSLNATSFSEGVVHFSFGGDAVEGVDFELTDENGQPFGADGMTIENDTHSFIIRGLPGADLSESKTIDIYLATSLCSAFPQLTVFDTMHFILDQGGDVKIKDTTIVCSQACFEVGTELVYGTDVTYQWIPTTGLDDPNSLTTSAMIFENTDYILIATGGSGCNSDTAEVHVVITGSNPDIPVGIQSSDPDNQITLFPNPASDLIHIGGDKLQRVDIFTADGRKVASYDLMNAQSDIDISDLADGVYSLRISTANGTSAMKLVVNK